MFVSSDRDEGAFKEYLGEMPWKAIPFSDRSTKEALSKRFSVRGIPTLVIVDEHGATISTAAREGVAEDGGAGWPYKPRSFAELVGSANIVSAKGGATIKGSELLAAVDHVFLYFSAHWCGPCRAFTPRLIKWYEEHRDTLAATGKTCDVRH